MRRKFLIISLIFLLALSGCAPWMNVKKAPPDIPFSSLGEEVLVFGRIRWIQNGEERKSYSGMFGKKFCLQVSNTEDMETCAIGVEKDGRFYTLLPKGIFIIHQLHWYDNWDGHHWLVPKIAFQIVDGPLVIYIGTLVVNIRTKRDLIGFLWVKEFRIHIEDEEREAMEDFNKRYADQEIKAFKALMIHDPGIPRSAELEEQTRSYDIFLHLLNLPLIINK